MEHNLYPQRRWVEEVFAIFGMRVTYLLVGEGTSESKQNSISIPSRSGVRLETFICARMWSSKDVVSPIPLKEKIKTVRKTQFFQSSNVFDNALFLGVFLRFGIVFKIAYKVSLKHLKQ